MATALKEIYPMVMERFYKDLEPEEMLELKAKGLEIRSTKVYTGN